MKKAKKVIKTIFIIVAVIVAILLLFYGLLVYALNYAVSTADESESPDGKYSLLLQSVGSPIFFGSADGRLILKEGRDKIATYDFVLYDDGGSVKPDIWQVTWEDTYVTVIISGSEQNDQLIRIGYDGEIRSHTLSTKFGRLPEESIIERGLSRGTDAENVGTEEANKEETSEEEPSEEALLIADGYLAIYNQLFQNQKDSYIEDYDAKGHSRVILCEDTSEIEYLVYDRQSQNEKCGLYVYYRCQKDDTGSWSPMDSSILDIYAYVYDTGEVISSGKTNWSDTSSEAYQNATGEP